MRTSEIVGVMKGVEENLERAYLYIWENLSGEEQSIRTGGYFCLLDTKNPEAPVLVKMIGRPTPENREKYYRFCQEKATRLAGHPEHHTSWQSRDESLEQYGGAVRFGDFIFSFSGLPELADEALVLVLLYTTRDWESLFHFRDQPSSEELVQMSEISSNPFFDINNL